MGKSTEIITVSGPAQLISFSPKNNNNNNNLFNLFCLVSLIPVLFPCLAEGLSAFLLHTQ